MSDNGPQAEGKQENAERIRSLQAQISDLKKRLPKHSIPAAMLVQLEDLEEALEIELTKSSLTGSIW